jgi:hypothetical protein
MSLSPTETFPLVRPEESPALSQDEYREACRIASTIRDIIAATSGQNAPSDHPSGHVQAIDDWICPSGQPVYGVVVRPEDMLHPSQPWVNQLRLHSHFFSGYHLTNMLTDTPIWSWTDEIGGAIPDAYLRDTPDWSVAAFLEATADLAPNQVCVPPQRLGETGWRVNGGIVNRDVMAYQERMNLLDAFGLLTELAGREQVRILEIGGGYGGLAYFLKQALPKAEYFICDLPHSLLFSATYLSLVSGFQNHLVYPGKDPEALFTHRDGYTFVPNHLFADLLPRPFDLVINTMSFAEMPGSTVEVYAAGAARLLGDWGFLFEQNFDNSHYQNGHSCEPKQIIAKHFQHRMDTTLPTRWGQANVWRNGAQAFGGGPRKPLSLSLG